MVLNLRMNLSFQEKKQCEDLSLSCEDQDIKQIPSLIFLGHPVDIINNMLKQQLKIKTKDNITIDNFNNR